MLKKCPECDLQISDKAILCPHCGYPLKTPSKSRKTKPNANRRRRLPNGFGQISEIKDRNLRNPFRVMVTTGKQPNGRPICKLLKPEAYFKTYNDAYAALVEYNRNPYDLEDSMTVSQLYERWSEMYYNKLGNETSIRNVVSAWRYCSSIYDMRVIDVRARHIKGCMENGRAIINGKEKSASPGIKERIKSLFNLMLDYAVEYDIAERNYSRTFSLSEDVAIEIEKNRTEHIPFSDSEIIRLWDNMNKINYIDVLLIQCYSGWRPKELGLIELKNVNLENKTIIGGIKTPAGIDRTVPIHPKIFKLIEKRYAEAIELGSEYLLNCTDPKNKYDYAPLSYSRYKIRFRNIVNRLGLNPAHRPHDGRVHFVTIAKRFNVDEYAIKYIIGHAINDITEKIYTQRDSSWLHEEIEKIE